MNLSIYFFICLLFCSTIFIIYIYLEYFYQSKLCINNKCITVTDIDKLKSNIQPDLTNYVKQTDLTNYAKQTDLTNYAKQTDLPNLPLCVDNQCLTLTDIQKIKSSNIIIVNRRPLLGIGKSILTTPVKGTFDNPTLLFPYLTYYPFQFGGPPPASGSIRKFRLYAVYSDTITQIENQPPQKGPVFRIDIRKRSDWTQQDGYIDFQFPLTWGGVNGETRDAYSDLIDPPTKLMHGYLYSYNDRDAPVLWTYVELQALDVY